MTRLAFVSVAACVALSITACSGKHTSSSSNNTNANDAGGGDDTHPVTEPGQVVQSGTIVDYDTKKPVAGATVSAAGQSVVTDAAGKYALVVEQGQPYTMEVSKDGYAKLVEQETTIDADFDRGATNLIVQATANLLLATLDGRDPALGVLSVQLIPTGACASEDGATVSVTPAGSAKVKYLYGGIPSSRKGVVVAGQFPSAVIYNVQPGVKVSVEVKLDKCTESAFPVAKDGVSYTGGIVTEPGESTSFARIFLQ
jgi:hypothetical protein